MERKLISLLVVAVLVFAFSSIAMGNNYYIDAVYGLDSNDGTSENPWQTIYHALILPRTNGTPENPSYFYVNPGTYNESIGEVFPIPLKSYIRIIGVSESPLKTCSNKIVDATGSGKNVFAGSSKTDILIDSLTIKGGNSNYGGGIYLHSVTDIDLYWCAIVDNTASSLGGGIHCEGGSSLAVSRCWIYNNTAPSGGGIYCLASSLVVDDYSDIEYNNATTGGGICVYSCTSATIDTSHIINNEASNGGGVYITGTTTSTVTGCWIHDNTAYNGGGVYFTSATTVYGCEIYENEASNGGGIYFTSRSVTIDHCVVENNYAEYIGGGIYGNASGSFSSPNIIWSIIQGNESNGVGGGIFFQNSASSVSNYAWLMRHCAVISNTAVNSGGGLVYTGDFIAENVLFYGNEAGYGGGAYKNVSGQAAFNNCTFAGNTATYDGGGIYDHNPNQVYATTIHDSIIWGNTSQRESTYSIYNPDPGEYITFVDHSDVYIPEEEVWGGDGNLNQNPLFIDGVYLQTSEIVGQNESPCNDTGEEDYPFGYYNGGAWTTRTDGEDDSDKVNMGFHFPISNPEFFSL